MNELALFAGAGGGILGGMLIGWRTACAVEINAYCARRLMQRQNEGHLPLFPIWDDVRTFDGRPWRGIVDVVSGGFPCQDISSAGKRKGIDGKHSGLWREMSRIIAETQPVFVFIENSRDLRTRGLVRVLKDLDSMGYDTSRGVFGAENCGAPHQRKRMWIVAHTDNYRKRDVSIHAEVASTPQIETTDKKAWSTQTVNTDGDSVWIKQKRGKDPLEPRYADWWPVDIISRVDDGMAHRMERIRATGNGQVPAVVRLAWETLRSQDVKK